MLTEHIFASAGALAFVNEYSGSAAPPAPYNAFAERSRHVPSHHCITRGEITHEAQTHTKPLRPLLASTGRMPNMIFASRPLALRNGSTSSSSTRPEAIDAWVTTLRTRFNGQPVAVCLELNKGPLVSALRKYDFLVLFPDQSPDPGTVSRSLYPQPGQR